MAEQPFVFISYAHADSETVLPILKKLGDNGISLWYDSGIEAGSEWPEYIANKIVNCDRVIFFITESYLKSQNCTRELNFAIKNKKEILSVFLKNIELSPGVDMQLGSYQALFYERFSSLEEFSENLCGERFLDNCKAMSKPSVKKDNPELKQEASKPVNLTLADYEKRYKDSVQKLGEDHPDTIKAMRVLIIALSREKKFERAAQLQWQLYQKCLKLYGSDAVETKRAEDDLRLVRYRLEKENNKIKNKIVSGIESIPEVKPQPKSKTKLFFCMSTALFLFIMFFRSDYVQSMPFSDSKFKYAFIIAMILFAIGNMINLMLVCSSKKPGMVKKTVFFALSFLFKFMVNRFLCLLVLNISSMYGFWSLLSLVAGNVVLEGIVFVILSIIFY